MDLTEEKILVKKIREGDVFAFERLVLKYEKKLRMFLSRWIFDDMDKDEIIQNSFFSFYKNIKRIDEDKNISSYLYTIAKNEAIDLLRKQKRTLPLLDEVVGSDEKEVVEKMYLKGQVELLKKSIGRLKEAQKRVIKMYFFENLSYIHIQERLGLPLNTVKTLLRRAKINLTKLMNYEKR